MWSTFDDLAKLSDVRSAAERRSIAAGTCAGSRVFWAGPGNGEDPEIATVLIGLDAEAWDIAFLIPVSLVEKIGSLADARHVD